VLEQFGPARSISAGRFQLAGPVVIGFVLVIFSIEQLWPAERRPLLARGHLLDLGYLVFYAVLVIPLVVLIGAGFADLLADAAPWLVLPRVPGVPGWCFVALAVLCIDAVDWLAHFGNHKITASGLIHLHLGDIAYRHVKTLDVLFLVQVAACLLAAIALLAFRRRIIVLGAAALMAGTIVGFILARTVGIFGFHLTFSSGLAYTVLVVEAAAVILLGITALLMPGRARSAA
jgi:hypothetical protein